MRVTDHYTLVRLQHAGRLEYAVEYSDTAARLNGELRVLAPASVRAMGKSVIQAFHECLQRPMWSVTRLSPPTGSGKRIKDGSLQAGKVPIEGRRNTFLDHCIAHRTGAMQDAGCELPRRPLVGA